MVYDVWRMNRRCDTRVGRHEEVLPAITQAKLEILPHNFVRVEHWVGTSMTVVWDSLDGDSAVQNRKSQLRDFIRRPRRRPQGGLR